MGKYNNYNYVSGVIRANWHYGSYPAKYFPDVVNQVIEFLNKTDPHIGNDENACVQTIIEILGEVDWKSFFNWLYERERHYH